MAWAATPEDVPPWDASRGFPLNASVRLSEEGGNTITTLSDVMGQDWQPEPPPTWDCYPKFVRTNAAPTIIRRGDGPEDTNLLQELHTLASLALECVQDAPSPLLAQQQLAKTDNQFRDHLLEFANNYGPLSDDPGRDGFTDWLSLVFGVASHLETLEHLAVAEQVVNSNPAADAVATFGAYLEGRKLRWWHLSSAMPTLADIYSDVVLDHLDLEGRPQEALAAYRVRVGGGLRGQLSLEGKIEFDGLGQAIVITGCGVLGWARYQLFKLWLAD